MRTPLVSGVIGIAMLSGCAAQQGAANGQTIVVRGDSTGIVVTGEGTAEGPPDTALLRIGVEARRPSVAEAREASARAASTVLEALKGLGVGEDDLQTERLSVRPEFEHTDEGRNLIGYVATNTVRVRMKNLDEVSAAVDAAVRAGGDDVQLHGIQFQLEDDAPVRAEARAEAMAEARAEAEQLAELAGVELGAPIEVEESKSMRGPQPMMARESADAARGAAPTPVEPGRTEVQVRVSVRYAIVD